VQITVKIFLGKMGSMCAIEVSMLTHFCPRELEANAKAESEIA
jgi:hypothetical protein